MAFELPDLPYPHDALDALRRSDAEKPASRPPRIHVEAMRPKRPNAAEAFEKVVDLYYRVRFAGDELDRAGRERAKALVAALRTELAASRR